MKNKLIIGILLLFSTITIACSKDNVSIQNSSWEKLSKNVSFNSNSIETKKDSKTGWFRIYNAFNNQNAYYEDIKIEAYCDVKVLHIRQTKSYDKNHNLLQDEINNYNVGCDYKGLDNGEIYYKSLCRN